MTAYADLDTSTIDELPPGRTPVTTVAIPDTRRSDIIDRVRNACTQEGRQAYWVCTLIEESELLEAQAAEATWEELKLALPELKVGLVHGRMKPAEKQAVMQSFKQGDLHLLIATTVIEVGVDVPNSSLMIIENPERLALRSSTSCVAASGAARWPPTACCSTKPAFENRRKCVCRCCATATTVS
jgi:ATP-dependent DNA helicase RecG